MCRPGAAHRPEDQSPCATEPGKHQGKAASMKPSWKSQLPMWLCASMALAWAAVPVPAVEGAAAAGLPPVVLADFDQTGVNIRASTGVTAVAASPPRAAQPDELKTPQREGAADEDTPAVAEDSPPARRRAEPPTPTGKACHVSANGPGGVAFTSERWPDDWRGSEMLCFWVFRQRADERPETVELRCVEADGRANFWRKIELRHSGWKRIDVPLSAMRWGDQRAPRWDKVKNVVLFLRQPSELWLDSLWLAGGTSNEAAELTGEPLARLAFSQSDAASVAILRRDHVELITDSPRVDTRKLADHLQKTAETVLTQLALPKQEGLRGTLIVFDRDADYRRFVPRLGAYWNAQAAEPQSGGFTVQAIATAAYSEQHGSLRPVFTHEFIHSLLARALRISNRGEWLHEGLANYYQLRFHPQENIGAIVRAGVNDSAAHLPLEQLCSGKPIPMNRYWQAMTVAEMFLTDDAYRRSLPRLLDAFGTDGSTDLGPRLEILGKDWTSLAEDWKQFCLRQYAP